MGTLRKRLDTQPLDGRERHRSPYCCGLWPVCAPLDNYRYVADWTVRRRIGKGVPPREFRTAGELIEYVQSTPGAIGYVAVARPQARVGRRLPAVR